MSTLICDFVSIIWLFGLTCYLFLQRIWKVLTSNYGHVMPVDWKQSRTCSLHKPSYNLEEKPVSDSPPYPPSLSHFPFNASTPTHPNLFSVYLTNLKYVLCQGLAFLIKFPPPVLPG